jgi:hypothetical protein
MDRRECSQAADARKSLTRFAILDGVGDQCGLLAHDVSFRKFGAAQRGVLGTQGPGGKAGRSKAAVGIAKRRGAGREQSDRSGGLEIPARAGVIPKMKPYCEW